MHRICWDPSIYTALSFACVPTGAVKNALFIYKCFIHVFPIVNINKLHINNEYTAI
jgi:hypothetical protein